MLWQRWAGDTVKEAMGDGETEGCGRSGGDGVKDNIEMKADGMPVQTDETDIILQTPPCP